MCDTLGGATFAPKPEAELSKLIFRELGIDLSPAFLRIFIKYNWDEIKLLAHQIHKGA